ncbi:helix-turn-helix transcriptional regulator [Streptomyces venezuelae]|uniref:helix-turn-helix transcriptional regulator n=1 Tax=Streptomyces venezuelae TaxID=54571 RepID=UPI0037AB7E83
MRAWGELVRSGGTAPVGRLAGEVGWSVRQLENRFREQIGIGPKAAGRVVRLQRARAMLAAGRGQAETAALCGYYDQAHLSGEFRAKTGCTPGQFTAPRPSGGAEGTLTARRAPEPERGSRWAGPGAAGPAHLCPVLRTPTRPSALPACATCTPVRRTLRMRLFCHKQSRRVTHVSRTRVLRHRETTVTPQRSLCVVHRAQAE